MAAQEMAQKLEASLSGSLSGSSTLSKTNEKLVVSRKMVKTDYNQQLSISFKRTVRVADNGPKNELPPDLGSFPIYRTKDFETQLPEHMAGKEGYFIPMYPE